MSEIELSEKLLSNAGGWQAMKEARGILKAGRVLAAEWNPPNLLGEVQGANGVLKTGLLIEGEIDIENICPCMENRRWGRICGHSIAVGLRILHPPEEQVTVKAPPKPSIPQAADVLNLAAEGDEAALHVIIPPNFEQSVFAGRASVCFEFEAKGKRRPLNLAAKDPMHWSENDLAVLELLIAKTEGELPAMLPLDLGGFVELLERLAGNENVTLGRKTPVDIGGDPFPLKLQAALQPDGELDLSAKLEPQPMILPGANFWAFHDEKFQRLDLPAGGAALLQGSQSLSREQVPVFLEQQYPNLMATDCLEADFSLDDFKVDLDSPRIALHLEGGLARLKAQLTAVYESVKIDLADPPGKQTWIPVEDDSRHYLRRDRSVEQGAIARLVRNGFKGPNKDGEWELRGDNEVLRFFASEYPRLQNEWQVSLQERLDWAVDTKLERIAPQCKIRSSGEQWFDFSMQFAASGGQSFSPADIQRLVLGGQSHTKLKNGKIAVIDTGAVEELQEVLVDAAPEQTGDGYRFRTDQSEFLTNTIEQRNGWQIAYPKAWGEKQKSDFKPDLGAFEKIFRPYQREGADWLLKLRTNGFGGILADEMGLGKTLQALAVVQSTRGKDSQPCLVICPTSVVSNWAAEAEKFAPQLKVLMMHGPKREQHASQISDHDLVITSYALIRRDWDWYDPIEFDTVILDEAQHIKNRQTQNAQAVKAIKCRHRLVLTGTPMENSVLDLWSIFDFLMPNYLGSAQDFRERYELPLAKGGDPAVQERLGRRVRPFILRRLKRDVAKDLPDKIEQVSFCDLTQQQRQVYQQILEAGRKEVLESVDQNGFGKSRMVIFNALLRLRQICCDLRLLKLDNVDASKASGKCDFFDELLEEITDGGHRVLVFSQFTTMLGLLRDRLEESETEYCYLDGSTRQRGEVVNRFQRSDIPVFLISLKAGGVGLNLTGADTVVHFDPWWNPAVEDQATDRAHRIGQQNVVTSYKLIARDTVEEKILKLQEKKRAAIRTIFGDEEQMTEALSWDEVQELFS
ncbi:MAG: DEAD/DEAH box helicase [Limisphaerales bacterium]